MKSVRDPLQQVLQVGRDVRRSLIDPQHDEHGGPVVAVLSASRNGCRYRIRHAAIAIVDAAIATSPAAASPAASTSTDGLLGRGDVAHRLEVMRDPRLGSYGVTAIAAVLLLEVAAISSMSAARGLAALVIAGALSRLATLAVIAFVPYVRASGLGVAAWDSRHRARDLAIGAVGAGLVGALDWKRALIAVPFVALTTLLLVVLARARVGGATGDVCGATAELCQVAVLLVFAVR